MIRLLERNLVYPSPRFDRGQWNPRCLEREDVFFSSVDGVRLHGWYAPIENPRHTLLYCHGQSEQVGQLAGLILRWQTMLDASVMVFDYRGYGQSQGTPHEEGCIADGLAAQQWLAERTGSLPEDLVIVGRSLGGGVAVGVAAERGAKALVLENTFSSLPDVADHWFKGLPARWFMSERYESARRIADYYGPLFQTHNLEDQTVPYRLGRRLFRSAPTRMKRFYTARGRHHDLPPLAYYERLAEFLEDVDRRRWGQTSPMFDAHTDAADSLVAG